MTPNEIIFAIREKLKEYVDDTRYTSQYLMFLVDLKREVLIRQQYNQIQRSVDTQLEQLFILPMEIVDASDIASIPVEDDELIRSVIPIPMVIELHHRNLYSRIATRGKLDRPMNLVSMRRFVYVGEDEFEGDSIFCMIDEDNYLYARSKSHEELSYEETTVRAVYARPLELIGEKDLNTFKYPANAHFVDTIINMIVQELASLKPLPTDQSNDSSDDATILKQNSNAKQ